MANQVLVEGDQGNSDVQQVNSFPFTSEQYQQLLSLLNSHASTSGNSSNVVASTNSAISGNLCASFQDFVCLNMQHSIFAKNPASKTIFGKQTWVLNIGATDHIVLYVKLFTKITSLSHLLFNYLMVKELLSYTLAPFKSQLALSLKMCYVFLLSLSIRSL